MADHLVVESSEAHRLAHKLATQTGRPVAEIVVAALKEYGSKLPAVEELTSDQRAAYDELRDLARRTAASKLPGVTSDHSDMYDEFGLPK